MNFFNGTKNQTIIATTASIVKANVPSAPTNVTVVTKTGTWVNVSFTAPTNVTPTGYIVTAVPTSGTTVSQTFTGTATSLFLSGLSLSTQYTVSVKALKNDQSSSSSTGVVFTTFSGQGIASQPAYTGSIIKQQMYSVDASYNVYILTS